MYVGFEGLRWLSRVGFFGFDSGVLGSIEGLSSNRWEQGWFLVRFGRWKLGLGCPGCGI